MSASATPDPTATFPPPRQGTSVGQVFAFVAGFVALAAVGAAIGWFATESPKPESAALSTSPSPSVSQSLSPSPTPTATPTTTAVGTPLPDFHQLGTTFYDARAQLSAIGVGTALIFNDQGTGVLVDYTVPIPGTILKRGATVKVFVTGPAPLLQVRDVVGQVCNQGGKKLAADGLRPSYPDGRDGIVMSTEPSADDTQTRWNDPIKVHCGVAGPTTTPSETPSTDPPTVSPSPSPSS